jgi:hypothetical protein
MFESDSSMTQLFDLAVLSVTEGDVCRVTACGWLVGSSGQR